MPQTIEEYLKNKKITKCPTACVAPTTGTLKSWERKLINRHSEKVNQQIKDKEAERERRFSF